MQIYHRLTNGPVAASIRLPSGGLVARVGAYVDEIGHRAGSRGSYHGRLNGLVTGGNCCFLSYFSAGRCGTGDLPTNHRCCGALVC